MLLEGEAGVGKTELAKVLAAALGTRLIRLQCYEGLDVNTAVYEWNYPRQMLEIRLLEARGDIDRAKAHDIFSTDFLIKRPLLQALESDGSGLAPVLLIDEIDRADEEFEAYLLEILSDFQVTVPEIGTIRAEQPPRVILTSNRTREVHDALKRRCLYHWIDYPTPAKEYEIVLDPGAGRPGAAGTRGGRLHPSPARGRPDQGARRGRDARLGSRAALARCRELSPEIVDTTPRRRPQVRGGHPTHPGRDRRAATWPRPRPEPRRGSRPSPATDRRRDRIRSSSRPDGRQIDGRRLLGEAVGFGRALRAGGLAVDLGAAIDFSRALTLVEIGDREQVRAAGEAVFVRRRDDRVAVRPHLRALVASPSGAPAERRTGAAAARGRGPSMPTTTAPTSTRRRWPTPPASHSGTLLAAAGEDGERRS